MTTESHGDSPQEMEEARPGVGRGEGAGPGMDTVQEFMPLSSVLLTLDGRLDFRRKDRVGEQLRRYYSTRATCR